MAALLDGINYTLRKSKRAKRLQLRITPQKGLEVILPKYGCRQAMVDEFIHSKRHWINKHLNLIQQRYQVDDPQQLPTSLDLLAVQQTWTIDYIASDNAAKLITRPQYELVVMGNLSDDDHIKGLLKRWLSKQAKQWLTPWLDRLSLQCQLPYSAVSIRQPQTRWGSCSANKSISLNAKLLCLPEHLVRYVLIHELCHTKILDHSNRFWQLVQRYDPNWQQHKYELHLSQQSIPLWLEMR